MQRFEQVNIACVLKLVLRLETSNKSVTTQVSVVSISELTTTLMCEIKHIIIDFNSMLCSEKNQNYTIASLFYSQSKSNLQYVQRVSVRNEFRSCDK